MHLLDIWSRTQWSSLHTTWYSKYICIVISLGLTCYSVLLTSLNLDTQLDVMANCMHEQCYWTLDRFVNVAFVIPCQGVSLGLTYDATYDGCHLYNYTRNNLAPGTWTVCSPSVWYEYIMWKQENIMAHAHTDITCGTW